ncbi:hypothetical protein ZHAS_00006655 [Anopheles sinensis]|uniref:Uncharacterized protein n=1 Tax=Anopheles sinensis TaxID=74873 RepID=A0A084VMV7_ANOSI|nr:hypothetical protein ZHAS_00006655 [Anopheles sinensis]
MSSSDASASQRLSSQAFVAPSSDSFQQRVENLREKYRDIVQEGFFRNLQHDWLHREAAEPNLSSTPTYECLSDQSGSFIVLNGRKFPLEFFRSASPKLAEASRTEQKVALEKIDQPSHPEHQQVHGPEDDYCNPYAVPTREQIAAQNVYKNRFHTARSRGREHVRQRLHVEDLPLDAELLGPVDGSKFGTRLATQLDAHYRNELTYRPRIHNFTRTSAIHNLRESGRRQFETFFRQEYLVGQTRKHQTEDECYRQLGERCVELQEAVRTIRQERFSATMRMLDTVKPYFETSAQLERRLKELQGRMTGLWNQVVRLESVWVRRLKLQNFLYLIMPIEWRERNDWIHRNESGQLESYPVSIAQRNVANIRDIDAGNDIWAVKRFYEEEFLAKNKPIHAVYSTPSELLQGVAKLNTNSMTLLSRLDLMNWVKTNAEMESAEIQRTFAEKIQSIRRFIQDTDDRRKFYKQRALELRQLFENLVEGPLKASVMNARHREIESLITVTYGKLRPAKESSSTSVKLSGETCFGYIFDTVLQLLAAFDQLPADLIHTVEQKVRFQGRRAMRRAVKAAEEEQRISQLAVQLRRALAPPYAKPTHKIKPPRSRLRCREVPPEVVKPRVSELDKVFRMAFGAEAIMTPEERRNFEIDMIYQNYCSVQFDHFLRSIGYEPDYSGVTRVEQRDGLEENFFKRKELVPRVQQRVQQWLHIQQLMRERLFRKMSKELEQFGANSGR